MFAGIVDTLLSVPEDTSYLLCAAIFCASCSVFSIFVQPIPVAVFYCPMFSTYLCRVQVYTRTVSIHPTYRITIYIYIHIHIHEGGSKSFRPDQLFNKVPEIKQLWYFSIQSPFISTHTDTDTLTSPQMTLYIPRSIFIWRGFCMSGRKLFDHTCMYIYIYIYICVWGGWYKIIKLYSHTQLSDYYKY